MACSISSMTRSILPPGQARTSAPIWCLFSTPLTLRRSEHLYRRFNISWALTRRLIVFDGTFPTYCAPTAGPFTSRDGRRRQPSLCLDQTDGGRNRGMCAEHRPLVRHHRGFGLRLEHWHDLSAEPLQLFQRLLQRGAHRGAAHVDLLQAGVLLLDGQQLLDNALGRATEPGARLYGLLDGGQSSVAGS